MRGVIWDHDSAENYPNQGGKRTNSKTFRDMKPFPPIHFTVKGWIEQHIEESVKEREI